MSIDDQEGSSKVVKSLQTQSLTNVDAVLRGSVDVKKKSSKQRGPHHWKRQTTDNIDTNMSESKTPNNTKPVPVNMKKTTSLNEARQKHKVDRARNERFRKSDNFNDKEDDEDIETKNVPRLIPAKSSPINDPKLVDDLAYSIPSYRNEAPFDLVDNWEVSRIERNSELERSFKKEMRGILPEEETKHYIPEAEKRLNIFGEESDGYLTSHKQTKEGYKKVSASPASEINLGTSMITSNKDHSKYDLSRMMITVDQYIYVISGYKTSTLGSVERLNMNKGIWQEVTGVNIPRTKFGSVCVLGQKIYILGGKLVDGTRTDIIEEYDVNEDIWVESKMKLPSPRSGFSNVLLNYKQLIVIGGNDGQVLDNVDLLNLATGEWSLLPPMSIKRDELAVTIGPDGKVYAIGGYGGQNSTCLKSVERFNFQTYTWEKVADLNEPRRALAAVSLPDGVYAIGGYNGSRYLGSMERYDEVKNKWIK